MKVCIYLGLNNYYNRRVVRYETLAEYQDKLLITIDNYAFKPNDGISTSIVVNTYSEVDHQPFIIESVPDYVIVAEDDNTINSRWFILEWTRNAKGQYYAKLRRDVVADNYQSIIDAPVFIEKATITDKTDVALFNNESMTFNQIKTSETLLKDLTNCPWIVGYMPGDTIIMPSANDEYTAPPGVCYNGDWYTFAITGEEVAAAADLPNIPNSPFKMFCMPYADLTCYVDNGADANPRYTYYPVSKDVNIIIAMSLAKSFGSANIFDVQLLPYCPLRTANGVLRFLPDASGVNEGKFNITNLTHLYKEDENDTEHTVKMYTKIVKNDESNVASLIFWCDQNKFSFDITKSLPLPDTAMEIKVKNETEIYRLCSPNYSGQFEFNPMKNGGVTKFNVDCMYQPFSPYIHINPDFGNLYGQDFDDSRGLILSGDFSLPQETSAWANYVQSNKNYQQIFNRQIENMEFNNRIAMTSQVVSALTGTGQGAVAGSFLGGPIGTAVGAAASGIGGLADTIILGMQQKETLDYTKDQFGYQLGNIKAMPNSISKTNPFTNNNKIFPVLEYYTCKDVEKQALKDKLKYNGMTVMRIGKIKDWLTDEYTYIKGKLIEIEIDDEYHTVVEIAQEIDKGVRIKTPAEEE